MFSSKALRVAAFAAASLFSASALAQAGKPAEIKIGITTFLSGPASLFSDQADLLHLAAAASQPGR